MKTTNKVINKKYYELNKGDVVQFVLGVLPDYTYDCTFDYYEEVKEDWAKGKYVTIYFSDSEVNICIEKDDDVEVVVKE